MKILLFGGSFDPPHMGHISILKTAIGCENFEKVIIMPTGTPTHKSNCVAPFDVRKKLAETAFCPISPVVEVSDYEGTNLQEDYTYLTLQHLKHQYKKAEIYMLIGGDSLLSLKSWSHSGDVLHSCSILAFARRNGENRKISDEIAALGKKGANIKFIESPINMVSSSEIRTMAEKEEDISQLVEINTKKLIDEYNLYKSDYYNRVSGTTKLLIKLLLNEKRQKHVLNVEKLAVHLGKIYNLDTQKLSLTALLHDIMKRVPPQILLHRARQSDIITKIDSKPFPTLHGYAAADYAKKELGVYDEEILTALKSHTCGRAGMSDFEKVIYLADMLSEERSFDGKSYLLSLAEKNLDIAMEKALQASVEWLKQNDKEIDTDSAQALEYFEKLCGTKQEEC